MLFDGASALGLCAAGFVLKLAKGEEIKGWINAGRGTNTRAEIIGLWSGLYVARWWGLRDLFVAGDSQVIINWALDKALVLSLELFHWLNDSKRMMREFICCSYFHIYRELNVEVDSLSKTSLGELDGKIHLSYFLNGSSSHETVCFSK